MPDMKRVDVHQYDGAALPVELECSSSAVRISTQSGVPCATAIRRVLATACMVTFDLQPNYAFEGGVTGVLQKDALQDDDLSADCPVEMRWVNGDHEVWLASDTPRIPTEAEGFIAEFVYSLLENAIFGIARDSKGYPLILSSRDEKLVTYIMLEACRNRLGGLSRNAIVNSLVLQGVDVLS